GWLSASRFKRCAYSMNSGSITYWLAEGASDLLSTMSRLYLLRQSNSVFMNCRFSNISSLK
ncbi:MULTISPECIES: hypothetical protein, partial [Pseudomonas]|uniref:hypothetical protein n=1 Tax=Pseudomonas TaxID=286 RepID=UPI00197DCFC1